MKKTLSIIGLVGIFAITLYAVAENSFSTENNQGSPSPQNYTVTVNIAHPDCPALEYCYFEIVLYRGNSLNDWQAIDRTDYIYGTNSYVFYVSVDPSSYTYIGTKMLYQPGTSCSGYQHDISDVDYFDITPYPNGTSFSLTLDPCN